MAAAAGVGLVGVIPLAAGSGRRAARAGRPHGYGPREYVVTGAYVLTMDPALGDVADGEVHVRDGEIVAVGRRLGVRAPRIDGSDTVVMPGLVVDGEVRKRHGALVDVDADEVVRETEAALRAMLAR